MSTASAVTGAFWSTGKGATRFAPFMLDEHLPRDVPQFAYTEEEWNTSGGHRPLRGTWTSRSYCCSTGIGFGRIGNPTSSTPSYGRVHPAPDNLVEDAASALFLWYALLWSVVEALQERGSSYAIGAQRTSR